MIDRQPSAMAEEKLTLPFHILKALAYFETSLLEPDILNPSAWEDDYSEFVEELKLYFGASDLIGESESKIENLTIKSSQRIAKYIVKFNRLATITGWDGRALPLPLGSMGESQKPRFHRSNLSNFGHNNFG